MRRSLETAEAYLTSLKGHLRVLPEKEKVMGKLVELLSDYRFVKRSKGGEPHPQNIYKRKKDAPIFDVQSAEGLAAITLFQMLPYYNANTQRRILDQIIKGLEGEI